MEKTKNEFTRLINSGITLSHAIYQDNNLSDLLEKKYTGVEDYFIYFRKYLRDLLKKYLLAYDNIEDINVYTTNDTMSSADTYYTLNEGIKRSIWYSKLQKINNKILVYSSIQSSTLASKRKVSIIRKLDKINDGYENILKIDLNYKTIGMIISDKNMDGDIFLVDDSNAIIYSTDPHYMASDNYFTSFDEVKPGHGKFVINMDLSDTTCLTGWKIVGIFNESGITGTIYPALSFVSLLAIICLSAASLAIILISRSFNHRIITISRHMEKVKNQEFDLIEEMGGADEIGQLMSDFNSMALKIKKLIQDVYEADIQKKNLELERKQAELNALQSQINPHFLFNTLESIRIRSLMKNETETADIVKSLSKTFRRMLVWGNDLITVRSEIEYIKDYLQIQKYRFSEKLSYEIFVPDDVLENKISKMAIQPFIENSCVHGIEGKIGNGQIALTVKKVEDKLEILIEDNGCGIPSEKLDEIRNSLIETGNLKGANIGIRNVCNRLKLFYGNEFEFNIKSNENEGTQVYIKIPAIL
jgi:two-component system sensor histidine kinase YesM